MNVRLPKEVCLAIGMEKMARYGLDEDAFKWQKHKDVNLATLSPKQVKMLMDVVKPHEEIRGVKNLLKDCSTWLAACEGKSQKARTVKNFEALLELLIARTEGHRLYSKDDRRGVWQAYYCSKTDYHEEQKSRDSYVPAYATMELVWVEFGGRQSRTVSFHAEDCVGITPEEALMRKGYIPENPQAREEYLVRKKVWGETVEKVGKQYRAVGVATDDCDGNNRRNNSWYWTTAAIQLDKSGEPARVVVDLFYEDDDDRRDKNHYIDRSYWTRKAKGIESDEDEEEAIDYDEIPEPEIPLHLTLAVFDLRRQKRLRVDVGQLTEYIYDSALGSKLVLPDDERNLVELLLAHKGGFNDIISGKSGGSIILCAGIPGTGKTLTSEVYAEVMAKPLYSVQASQLGTNPNTLEEELLKAFARASRWGAILLLDEADVYVAKRGSDLQQNAIVGVFLRVLEYYKGVLFLTTNRADLVDDAIASRCLARIDYKAPGKVLQARIWEVLSKTAGIPLPAGVIAEVVEAFPTLTGRDVKNLLKLSRMVSDSRGTPITLETIAFVKRFKPTSDAEE